MPFGNEHLDALTRNFGVLPAGAACLPDGLEPVFLCYSNRCGSNYVAEAMASSGRINQAGEDFNHDIVTAACARERLASLAAYVSWRFRAGGRLACKISLAHLQVLGAAGLLDQLAAGARFVLIERGDKIAQAISYDIADQTGQWTSDPAPPGAVAPIYDFDRLSKIILSIGEQHARFDAFFERNGIAPLTLRYEAFVADPHGHVAAIGRHIGVPELRIDPANMRLRRQAGPLNDAWRTRFLTDWKDFSRAATPAGPARSRRS
jgi:LPS sulfotransferase NodH